MTVASLVQLVQEVEEMFVVEASALRSVLTTVHLYMNYNQMLY